MIQLLLPALRPRVRLPLCLCAAALLVTTTRFASTLASASGSAATAALVPLPFPECASSMPSSAFSLPIMSDSITPAVSMRAVQVVSSATVTTPAKDALTIAEVPRPVLKPGQVLIRVHAFGINRADLSQRKGTYPPPPGESETLGLECAGEIVQVAPGTELPPRIATGSRVMALLAGGAYAEFVAADAGCLLPIPSELGMVEAAALPEAFLTAFQLSRKIGGLSAGEVVLIHAGASGVGSALIQLAKFFGAIPIVTAGSEEKLAYCRQLGADFGCSYKTANWSQQIKTFLAQRNLSGVDVVLDPVGKTHVEGNFDVINVDGRWVVYALMSGAVVDQFNMALMMRKRVTLTGTTLRNRSKEYKAKLVEQFYDEVFPAVANKTIVPNVAKVFAFEEIAQAHAYMEADQTMGKLVVEVVKGQ